MKTLIVAAVVAAFAALAAGAALAHHSALHFGGSAAELLEPEKAFAMSARALDARSVEVSFAIADGYYLYRDRFRFAADPASSAQLGAPQRLSTQSSDIEIARLFESGGFWIALASFFGFGLLLAFTPCVLPMVPILSGIIAGEGKEFGKPRALALSLAAGVVLVVGAFTGSRDPLRPLAGLAPAIVFFDAQGRESKGLRVIGYQNADRFLETLTLCPLPGNGA